MKEEKHFNEVKNIIERIEVSHRVREIEDNIEKVEGYWNIGKEISEAQEGKRAKYGTDLIKEWGEKLSQEYGNAYSRTNLKYYRQFYSEFPIGPAVRGQMNWTHYKILLPIKNKNERNYYINQTILNHLSSRELDRLIKSKAFDRLSYADKEHIEIVNNNEVMDITDMIKDPIILNVNSKYHKFTEKVLHELLIKQLETRFLELGFGFALVGHEYKIREGNHTYRIDLLFFHYVLNAFVVVELKTRSMAIKDIDQVNYYVSLVDKHVKRKNHRKTIGILIAKEKDKYVIKYAINKDIYVSSYLLKQEHVV